MPFRLVLNDLPDLLYAIENVTDWMKLGVSLKLPWAKLKDIETQYKLDVGRCKMEMLTMWLNMDVHATWELLASALEKGLNMIRSARNIRQWLNNYAEFAVNGGLLDRSGNSGCGLVERVHVTSTQSPNGIPDFHRQLETRPKSPVFVIGPHHASTGSFSTWLPDSDRPSPSSASADSDPLLVLSDASPSAGPSNGLLTSFADPSSAPAASSPTKPSPIKTATTNPIQIPVPSATSTGHLPATFGSSSAPVRPSTISIGQSTENLQTASNIRRSSASPLHLIASVNSSHKQQKKRRQSLKDAAENQRIIYLKNQFGYLLKKVLDILQDEERTDVYQVQVLVQQLPISCSDPQRVLEPQERLDIQKAKSISQIFSILSGKYLTYENFGLLESIAQTFCNRRAKPLLDAYTKEYYDPEITDHSPLQQIITEEGRKLAKMKESFANLVVKIIRVFEKEGLNLLQLSVYIRSSSVKKLCLQEREDLKHPESVSHIFSIIISYVEYDNYDLLQCIVKRFGNDKIKRMMHKYKQKYCEQHDTARTTYSRNEDDADSFSTSDERSSILTNHTLTSSSSQSRSQLSSDVEVDSTHDCSAEEDREQQQHCLKEAASNQETTSAVDTLSAATVSTHQTNTDDSHSSATGSLLLTECSEYGLCNTLLQDDTHSTGFNSTCSHQPKDDGRSTVSVSTSAHQLSNDTRSTTTASTSLYPLPTTQDRSLSDSLALSQRVCYSDEVSNSSYLLAVTNGAASSTAKSSSLSTSATKSSPHIQTVVVKTFFIPWDKGQIHVQPRQKVRVDTRNLSCAKSGKNVAFVDVLTESGRKGKVPVSVLDIGSLPATRSRPPDDRPHDHAKSSQQSQSDRTSTSSSNEYCDISDFRNTKTHPPRSLKLRKKSTQTLEVDKLAATAATPDVTIARRVTWAPNISSTALSFPPVSRNNLSRPQSLPIPVSSSKPSPQESPQSAAVKLPKRSKARRFLSHVKGFFVQRNEFAAGELEMDKSSDACSDYTLSPKMELELILKEEFNSKPTHV